MLALHSNYISTEDPLCNVCKKYFSYGFSFFVNVFKCLEMFPCRCMQSVL